jgi:hypothetical protein
MIHPKVTGCLDFAATEINRFTSSVDGNLYSTVSLVNGIGSLNEHLSVAFKCEMAETI